MRPKKAQKESSGTQPDQIIATRHELLRACETRTQRVALRQSCVRVARRR